MESNIGERPTTSSQSNLDLQHTNSTRLSTLQRAFFMGRRDDFDLHVHTHLYVELDYAELDISRLESAFNTLIARHCMLRANIQPSTEIKIEPHAPHYSIPVHDLRHLSDKDEETQFLAIRQSIYRVDTPIDLIPNMIIEVTRLKNSYRVHISLDLLLLDGSSIRVVLHELSEIYLHPEKDWSPVPFDFQAYSEHLKRTRGSSRYQRMLEYWFKRLDTLPDGPSLPLIDPPKGTRRSFLSRRKHIIPADKWKKFLARSNELSVTPTALIFTAFSYILASWSKNQHYSVTMLIYQVRNQGLGELSKAVANFASTILMEVDLRHKKTFAQHAKDIHEEIFLCATKSMVCGMEVLQEKNRAEKSTFRAVSPVAFVSMVNEENDPVQPGMFQMENEHAVHGGLETPQVLFDHQAISRTDGGVALNWDTMDSAFAPYVLDRMFDAYVGLINDIIYDDNLSRRTDFDFRPPSQIKHHTEYNQTNAHINDMCLHQLLGQQSLIYANKTFLIDGDVTFTYAEFTTLCHQIARTLRYEYHVTPNELVAVHMEKGWQQVVGAVAINIAGAAYVPIDANLPHNRRQDIIERCNCQTILTTDKFANDSVIIDKNLVTINRASFSGVSSEPLENIQSPDDIAYVIFTSGSTGKPKGVVLDHKGPLNTVLDINQRFNIHANDVVFGISELSFDLSVYDIYGTIAAGATLVLPPPGANRDPAKNLELVKTHGVTIWNSVPALAQLFAEYVDAISTSDNNSEAKDTSVRKFMLSGDWIPLSLPEKLKTLFNSEVISLGGATEGSIWSIYYPIDSINPEWKSIPYGYPLANQYFYVLDNHLQERPDNVPGELYIGGIGVAKGYWKDDEKTQHAYITHPKTGEIIYRTGDWGMRSPHGHIEFLGREDGQVKVRGYRIELGEIESVLEKHPNVKSAVAAVIGKSANDRYVAAYAVLNDPTSELPSDELNTLCEQFLPAYMVPSRIIFIEKIPLGATGKVDRKALPEPDSHQSQARYEAPQGETETLLHDIWCELLNTDRLSRYDNFFDLGGNSFDAVRLVVTISEKLDVNLEVTRLLAAPTIQALASALEEKEESNENAQIVPLHPKTEHSDSLPNSFWFHPSGGNTLCYQEISQHILDIINAYGVQSFPSNEHKTFHSFQSLVEAYVSQIMTLQGSGPYHLAGWSMGGVLAYEAAQQLSAAGHMVASLTLIDSPAPVTRGVPDIRGLIDWFISDITLSPEPLHLEALSSPENQTNESQLLSNAINEAQRKDLLPDGELSELKAIYQVFKKNIELLHAYQGKPLPENITCQLIMASHNVEDRVMSHSQSTWSTLLPKDTSYRVLKGNHYTLLQTKTLVELTPPIRELFLSLDKRNRGAES